MRIYSLPPSASAEYAQGVGGTAGMILRAYGLMSSNPKVHEYEIELEPPFFPFVVPCPLMPETVEAEVVEEISYARRSSSSRVSYSTIRLWLSESDKMEP